MDIILGSDDYGVFGIDTDDIIKPKIKPEIKYPFTDGSFVSKFDDNIEIFKNSNGYYLKCSDGQFKSTVEEALKHERYLKTKPLNEGNKTNCWVYKIENGIKHMESYSMGGWCPSTLKIYYSPVGSDFRYTKYEDAVNCKKLLDCGIPKEEINKLIKINPIGV